MPDHPPPSDIHETTCCIAGGGPAGMMLGFLLARAGVDVVVLEKHADFLRDFRGDTIHPSTLDVMGELGLLDEFLKLPHAKAPNISAYFGGREYAFADFTYMPTRCKFVALMPQWDFLNFLADHGKSYPSFHLRMRAEAVDLIEGDGRVPGSRPTISARRWTCCGSACRRKPTTPMRRWADSKWGASSSCSTAATTGNAPS